MYNIAHAQNNNELSSWPTESEPRVELSGATENTWYDRLENATATAKFSCPYYNYYYFKI